MIKTITIVSMFASLLLSMHFAFVMGKGRKIADAKTEERLRISPGNLVFYPSLLTDNGRKARRRYLFFLAAFFVIPFAMLLIRWINEAG